MFAFLQKVEHTGPVGSSFIYLHLKDIFAEMLVNQGSDNLPYHKPTSAFTIIPLDLD